MLVPSWTVRGYLYALIAALAVPLLGLLALTAYEDFRDDSQYAADATLSPASTTAQATAQFIGDSRRLLEHLAERPLVRALDPERCDPLIAELPTLNSNLGNAWVTDRTAHTLCSARTASDRTKVAAARAEWLPQVLRENQFTVSRPYVGPVSGRPIVVLSAPVRNARGAAAGAVAMSIPLEKLASFATLASSPEGTRLAIIDQTGNVLAQLPESDQWLGKSIRHLPAAAHALRERRGVFDGHDLNGEATVFGFDSIPGVDWRVIVGIPAHKAYDELREHLIQHALAVGLTFILVAFGATWFSRRITRSVQGIAATVRTIAAGDLNARAPASGMLEIDEVAAQLNRMLDVRLADENALRESRRRLATLLSNIPGAAYRCLNDGAWSVEFISEGFRAVTGYDPDAYTGVRLRAWGEKMHVDDRNTWSIVEHALATRQPFQTEYRISAADGSEKWIWDRGCGVYDAAGNVVAIEGFLTDVTGHKQAFEALRESETRFRQLAENVKEVFWLSDPATGQFLYVSPASEKIWGIPPELVSANPMLWADSIHPADRARVLEAAYDTKAHGQYDIEYRIVRADGGVRWVHGRAFPVRNAEGAVYRIAGVVEDITDRKENDERLAFLAQYDTLTGLPNRTLFRDRLDGGIARARRAGGTLGLMFFDLDRFKEVNDGLGHPAGDDILQQVATRVRALLRETDTVARLGGDEFTVILEDVSSRGEVDVIAADILEALSEPMHVRGREVFVSASIGIARFPADALDAEGLVRNADAAMYQAKRAGRNTFVHFAGRPAGASEQITLESKLRRALERDEFLLHYQPQVSVKTGRIVGTEALIRWDNPELGRVPPLNFIPLAEETGLIVPIGEWVMRTAAAQNRAWQEAGLPPIVMAVNLSPRQFREKNLAQCVRTLLAEAKLDPGYFELEITESTVMQSSREAIAVLDELEAMGVQLSVDDFGTGYSSLAYLRRFRVHKLKVDQSFVRDSVGDADSAAIVAAVIAMARGLRLGTIAEGVETPEQLALLRSLGCDEYQGYLYSRPVPGDALARLLHEHARPTALIRA